MQLEESNALRKAWGKNPCDHPDFAKQYNGSTATGDWTCATCGWSVHESKIDKVRDKSARIRALREKLYDDLEIKKLESSIYLIKREAVPTKPVAENGNFSLVIPPETEARIKKAEDAYEEYYNKYYSELDNINWHEFE